MNLECYSKHLEISQEFKGIMGTAEKDNFGGYDDMGVSKNRGGPPKSSILLGFSIINHPFWCTPMFGNTHMKVQKLVADSDET